MDTLPVGSQVRVAAAIGRQLVVQHAGGAPDKYLRWLMEPQGMLWLPAERPDGVATFTVGDGSQLRLDFDAGNAPILSDIEKTVTLTSFDPDPADRNSREILDYQLSVKLPPEFEPFR